MTLRHVALVKCHLFHTSMVWQQINLNNRTHATDLKIFVDRLYWRINFKTYPYTYVIFCAKIFMDELLFQKCLCHKVKRSVSCSFKIAQQFNLSKFVFTVPVTNGGSAFTKIQNACTK